MKLGAILVHSSVNYLSNNFADASTAYAFAKQSLIDSVPSGTFAVLLRSFAVNCGSATLELVNVSAISGNCFVLLAPHKVLTLTKLKYTTVSNPWYSRETIPSNESNVHTRQLSIAVIVVICIISGAASILLTVRL